jgi:hypothetical protein
MGEIGNIGDINLENYRISFCSRFIDIDNYHIGFLKMLPFKVRNVEIKSINLIQNGTFSRYIEIISLHISVLNLYSVFV